MRLLLILLALAALAGCRSSSSRVEVLEDAVKAPAASDGAIFAYSEVAGRSCGILYINLSGTARDGRTVSEQLIAAHILSLELPVKSLPPGDYQIDSVECPDNYRVGGRGPLARFSVSAGTIKNLGTLVFVSEAAQGEVRPMNEWELEGLRRKSPDLVAKAVYEPMTPVTRTQ